MDRRRRKPKPSVTCGEISKAHMADTEITQEQVIDALRTVQDPDLRKDIVSLGMIQDIRICGGAVAFRFVLTTPACPVREQLESQARAAVQRIPGVEQVNVKMEASVPKQRVVAEKKAIEGVSNIVAVTSGKGGVGKTTVAVNLDCVLAK